LIIDVHPETASVSAELSPQTATRKLPAVGVVPKVAETEVVFCRVPVALWTSVATAKAGEERPQRNRRTHREQIRGLKAAFLSHGEKEIRLKNVLLSR
jgi:hypothetical protein